MQPVYDSLSAAGSTGWHNPDYHLNPFEISFYVNPNGNTVQIDLTNDRNWWAPGAPTPNVYNPTGFTSITSAGAIALSSPCTGWRMTISTYVSGTATVEAVQAGIPYN